MHRGYYVRRHSAPESKIVKERKEGIASKFASLLGLVSFISMIIFVVDPDRISWANLSLPLWLRWTGVAVALTGFALLQWSQSILGKSWSDTPRMMKGQILITSGPYRMIRHPIYTAFILILGSTLLISANWLIGLAWIGMTTLETISRIQFEENLMLEYFGNQYREYINRTSRLLPKIY